ncbi:hypothetical protein PLICRDRAFT_174631 [Plicaturopsis crispa FD-325 SS-3]|nr:hypothetical protein PLICRDRAFT_174631 [Plicaturopsis crispa FD-325 SS-3]
MTALSHHGHWLYASVPLFGAFIWMGTLWAMLITWLASGRPHYPSQDGHIAYISDVGASFLKPLFVVGCCVTAACFVVALGVERWLRHEGRLVPDMRRRERALSVLAILGALLGGAGLILLSVLDTLRHPSLHRVFLLVFMIGVAFSAIFTVCEYRWLSKTFAHHAALRRAYLLKAIIAGLLILAAIAFGIALYKSTDVGACLEWAIALGFTFYLCTFAYDLRLAKGVPRGELRRERFEGAHGGELSKGEAREMREAVDGRDANGGVGNGYGVNGREGNGGAGMPGIANGYGPMNGHAAA